MEMLAKTHETTPALDRSVDAQAVVGSLRQADMEIPTVSDDNELVLRLCPNIPALRSCKRSRRWKSGILVAKSDWAAADAAEHAAAERAANVKRIENALQSICLARGPGSIRHLAGIVEACTDLVQFSMHADAVRLLLVRRELDIV